MAADTEAATTTAVTAKTGTSRVDRLRLTEQASARSSNKRTARSSARQVGKGSVIYAACGPRSMGYRTPAGNRLTTTSGTSSSLISR